MMSTGFDRDQVGGSAASSRSLRDRGYLGGRSSEIDQPVDRQHADPAAIGQDREPLADGTGQPSESLRRVEELAQVHHAQQPRAAKRGVVDVVGAGQRAGMRCGRPGGFAHAVRP